MPHETDNEALDSIAQAHGVSADAARAALAALRAGHGRQAQFNHPDLGGLGQWSSGGMLMIGDMFNHALKAKVGALFADLAALPAPKEESDGSGASRPSSTTGRWPKELGAPSSTGSQNDMHYAVFPQSRRLAIERDGKMTIHDTGDHIISGVGQQQSGSQSLRFTSQLGSIDAADLPLVGSGEKTEAAPPQTPPAQGDQDHDAIIRKIESLHGLLEKNILSQEEYDEKKRELLARL